MRSRAFEYVLQIMIMVDVETAQCRQSLGMLQFSPSEPVLAAGPRLQGQPAIRPQLSLRPETMWRLDQSDQQGHADRAQAGNLPEKLRG